MEITEKEIFEELEALVKMGLAIKYLENGEIKYKAVGPHPDELKTFVRDE